jgi:glucose/mannose-6-phosphate isomerase
MDLNTPAAFAALDPEDMLGHIDGLPDQLARAWELGNQLPLGNIAGIDQVLISGMGGSAIGADLLAAYIEPTCPVPVVVQRDYTLPAWAHGAKTLMIGSSHSGNTEETLSVFQAALAHGCTCLAITTGGKLGALAAEHGAPTWQFDHRGQPRAAVGFSFGLLLALFTHLGLIPSPAEELAEAIAAMRAQQEYIRAHVPLAENPAKRLAGQLMGRWVAVFGSGLLSPAARRWKGQISELAKAWAQFEFLPEADHNTLAGCVLPEDVIMKSMALFLRSPSDHPRNHLRSNLTRRGFMLEGMNTDFVDARGDSALAHLWTILHFGDYVAYYLAMLYGVDPTPVAALENLKRELSEAK